MTGPVPLTVRNAQVTTATVEIRTLTVSGKQVTQAVFRQLAESPVIDEATGELRGLPWGTVNYHPDPMCKHLSPDGHLHVVWQDGRQLRRSFTTPLSPRQVPQGDVNGLAQALYCLNGHEEPPGWQQEHDWSVPAYRFTYGGLDCVGSRLEKPRAPRPAYPPGYAPAPASGYTYPPPPPSSYAPPSYPPDPPDPHQCLTGADRDRYLERLREAVTAAAAHDKNAEASWQALAELPQLFIAV